jgi:septum site-determining protein MinD
MKKLTEELKEHFDYVILDCPAGIEQGFKNAIAGADRAIVVTTPEVSAIRDADRIIGLLEQNGIHRLDLIINRIRMEMVKRGDMMAVEDVTDILSVDLIGVIPDDESIVIATNQGEPVLLMDSLSAKAYENISRRIIGETPEFLELDVKKGFFSKLSGAFRKK